MGSINTTDLRTLVAALDPYYKDRVPVYEFRNRKYLDTAGVNPPNYSVVGSPAYTATVNALFTAQFTATGGRGPATWQVVSGLVGTHLPVIDPVSAMLTVTPDVVGSFPVTVMVYDGSGNSGYYDFIVVVSP